MIKDLRKLKYKRLPYMWGRCHEALNGFWIDWWFSLKGKRLINNPGRKIQDKNKRWRTADIFFCKHKSEKLYNVVGIAEVENNQSKWLEKLETMQKLGKIKNFKHLILFFCQLYMMNNLKLQRKIMKKL